MINLSAALDRRLLQITVVLAGFVPVGGGLSGAILGAAMLDAPAGGISLDSHVRYLSGLLIGIGLAFWQVVPRIERAGPRVRLLTAIVFIGGLMRLVGVLTIGVPSHAMLFGLCMELGVTPMICLWQAHVARRFGAV